VWGEDYLKEQLSMYYLTLEVTQVTKGMLIAVPPKHWAIFRKMTQREFADTLMGLAREMDTRKYTRANVVPKRSSRQDQRQT